MGSTHRYIIIGAGPAGLAFAVNLLRKGEKSFIILERESQAGGLCRSAVAGGYPMDIGGGHLLEANNTRACKFIFSFLPENQWKFYIRQNGIFFRGQLIGFPFEAHLHQLPEKMRDEYMDSWQKAGAKHGEPCPESFVQWVKWQLGERIAQDYLLAYNQKLWGKLLPELGVDWLHKLPPKRTDKAQNFAAHNTFYYPTQHGFGEAFLRMAKILEGHIVYDCAVEKISGDNVVNGHYKGAKIINTAPWHTICADFPEDIQKLIGELKYTGVSVEYHHQRIDTDTQAIYYPEEDIPYHRAVLRYNYNRHWPGYWTESAVSKSQAAYHHRFAYPAQTMGRQEVLDRLFAWARGRSIEPLGRWGQWAYINTDQAICRGLELAENFTKGGLGVG
ncbi:MAG: NAD(P)-binding protein [Oscillospiraceae bacterium]|nr:NAD(P)-binding protein [Oscillospiraceae bacterium]